jgi:tripartite-type tricarboxylate transporter receptor subunit TctC
MKKIPLIYLTPGRLGLAASTALIALSVIACITSVRAADYPVRPIRVVVPYPPGAFNDQLARIFAQRLQQSWGQPMVVDNRPGGGSVIGTDLVAKAAPDGYTLLINSFAFAVNPSLQAKLNYDSERDFAPLILAATTPNLLVVNAQSPIRSVKEFIALARAQPGTLTYASAGNGASNHLCMELLKSMTGIDLIHVPYKGSVPAVTDLLGGQVQIMFDNTPNVAQHIKTGKLRALATTSAKRGALLPDLPTVAETVPGFEVSVWFGVMVPAATPKDIVGKLNTEMNLILKSPDVVATFEREGVEAAGGTPSQFASFIRAQTVQWSKVIKSAGIRLE